MVGAGAAGVLCGDDVLGLGDALGLGGALIAGGGVMVAGGGVLGAGVYMGAAPDVLGEAAVAGDDDAGEAGAEAGG